jgi:hypothetical protein
MRVATIIVASGLAHGALFAVLSQITPDEPSHASTRAPSAQAPAPHEGLIEFVVLSEGASPAAPSSAPTIATRAGEPSARVSARGSTATGHAIEAGRPAAEIAGSGSIGTDGSATTPGIVDLALGGATAERIANAGRPRGAEPKVTGRLESTPGGGAVVHDLVTTMTVERDGNIKFDDKPDIETPKLKLPIPNVDIEGMRKDLGSLLTDWYKDPTAATKFGPMSEVSRVWRAVPDACTTYGDVWCDDALAPAPEKKLREQKRTKGSIAGGTADISAALQRKYVGDPYASRKLGLIDSTRDERVARGGLYRQEVLDSSLELVQRTLKQLWATERDPSRRKQALFELWDECDESDDSRGEAGQRARAMILGWIRTHLPQGAAGGYSPEEIARLHAKRSSKQAFTPY